MKIKKLIAVVLAATMTIISAVPAAAAVTGQNPTGYFYTDNGKNIKYPCWIWLDGACYYYKNAANILKNTTTPDGYTVDAEGRWTVNGQIQSNGYGYQVMGTDVYNGKSNDEIWNLMVDKLENAFSKGIPTGNEEGLTYAYWRTKDQGIAFDIGTGATVGHDTTIIHNDDYNKTFITARIGDEWSDLAIQTVAAYEKTAYASRPMIREQTIKAVVGDQIGQELFHYIKNHADKTDTSGGYKTMTDSNGNYINGWFETGINGAPNKFTEDPDGPDWKCEWVTEPLGDGIHAETLDLSAWQNRMTDYGKRFDVINNRGAITIKVYD